MFQPIIASRNVSSFRGKEHSQAGNVCLDLRFEYDRENPIRGSVDDIKEGIRRGGLSVAIDSEGYQKRTPTRRLAADPAGGGLQSESECGVTIDSF